MDGLPTMASAAAPAVNGAGATADPAHIPRRNLSEAFENLYVSTPLDDDNDDPSNTATTPGSTNPTTAAVVMKQIDHHQTTLDNNSTAQIIADSSSKQQQRVVSTNLISPTGVADLHAVQKVSTANPTSTKQAAKVVKESTITAATQVSMTTDGLRQQQPAATTADVVAASGTDNCSLPSSMTTTTLPLFSLHTDLQRDLSQALVNRVSFFAVIHDINKEATAMAANDDSGLIVRASNGEDVAFTEQFSPLVEAVNGPALTEPTNNRLAMVESDMLQAAMIDEEKWLLSAIETRGADECRPIQACPPTFSQAMGEREYENPVASLSSGSRTQLWKPSRSWWEAKSGKNPWIEPKSHNKRWRYLWPLIHYHKFLAKCIKKLKRNGVDVKMSVSPVAAFLREEVCAVSDHLASVSMFDSEEWMSCLNHFSGWTDTSPESEANLRLLIGKLHLRPLDEHGDVDSPLLRSQIDEQYLRAMAAARTQMEMSSETGSHKNGSRTPRDHHNQANGQGRNLPYSMESAPPPMHAVPNNAGGRGNGLRRPRLGYPPYPYQWWNQGWQHHHYQHSYPDDASVHSSLSGEYPEYGMYPGAPLPNGQFCPPGYHHPHAMQHSHVPGGYDPNFSAGDGAMYGMHSPNHFDHAGLGFFGHPPVDPSMAYAMHQEEMGGYYGGEPPTPKSPQNSPSAHQGQVKENDQENAPTMGQQTPFKFDGSKTPRSPYWGHLDATIAMGLSTPQTHTKGDHHAQGEYHEQGGFVSPEEGADAAGNAQPLLLRQSQYYGYGPVSNYGPPSPATQFMMSPQANFAMNYGYGYSPSHGHVPSHYKQSPHHSSSLKKAAPGLSPATGSGRKTAIRGAHNEERESPSTVETITESESTSETA